MGLRSPRVASSWRCSLPQPGQVHATHSSSNRHPEEPEDVRGEETLPAEAGRRPGRADHPQSLHGPAEVPGGTMETGPVGSCILLPISSHLLFSALAAAGAQGADPSEARPRLVGSLLVPALPQGHRVPAVLHPQDEGQARAEEAEDRSPLSGALQEAQQGNGEQDHAAAEKDR